MLPDKNGEVLLYVAVVALVAGVAAARVVVDAVDALAELAGACAAQRALVDVDLAVIAFESGQAAADVSAGGVVRKVGEDGQVVQRPVGTFQASCSVLAWNRLFCPHSNPRNKYQMFSISIGC